MSHASDRLRPKDNRRAAKPILRQPDYREYPPFATGALAKIADFIYFIRRKTEQAKRFAHNRENTLLAAELKQLGISDDAFKGAKLHGFRLAAAFEDAKQDFDLPAPTIPIHDFKSRYVFPQLTTDNGVVERLAPYLDKIALYRYLN